jgi:hypothetical protein|tara:strand:+ start:487 stop:2589 length:2103 start_codon:yes stop_codon:yes gene_type:complete
MPSGSGKDRTLYYLNNIFEAVFEAMKKNCDEYKKNTIESNDRYVKETGLTGSMKTKFLENNYPRNLVLEVSASTPEGIVDLRKEFLKANFGSVHFKHSEFIDHMTASTKDVTKEGFNTLLTEVYESGESTPKVIKMDKESMSIKDVPHTMLVHSSFSNILSDVITFKKFKSWINRGLGRRCIFSFLQEEEDYVRRTAEERKEIKKSTDEALSLFKDPMLYIYSKTKQTVVSFGTNDAPTHQNKEIHLTEDALEYFINYEEDLNFTAKSATKGMEEGEKGEYTDRHRKSLRLAGCIAAICHPDKLFVNKSDLILARHLVEFFGKQFKSLINFKEISDVEIAYNFIKNHGFTTKGGLRELCKSADNNKRTAFVRSIDEYLPEYCEKYDEELIISKPSKNTVMYKIEPKKLNLIEVKELPRAGFSPTKNAREHPVGGYQFIEKDFKDVPKVITKYNYTTHKLKNNYRKTENVEYLGNMLIYDVDNYENTPYLSVEEAKERVKEICSIILPTQSHNREKKSGKVIHPPAERFRIIVLCNTPVNPAKAKYDEIIKRTAEDLGLLQFVDVSASDASRYFKPSRTDFEWININNNVYSWEWSDYRKEKPVYGTPKKFENLDDIKQIPIKGFLQGEGKPAGKDMLKYCCPLHKDGDPSFVLYEKTNSFNCFGCKRGGDIIRFYEYLKDYYGKPHAFIKAKNELKKLIK